jgi:hypothetical protein
MMDTNTAVILIVVLFALIIIGAFAVFRRRSKVTIDTVLGKLEMEHDNEPPAPPQPQPGVLVENVETSEGGILAEDKTGRGTAVKGAKAKQDILASSENPNPKA